MQYAHPRKKIVPFYEDEGISSSAFYLNTNKWASDECVCMCIPNVQQRTSDMKNELKVKSMLHT